MTEIDAYIQRLMESNPIREPVLRSVLQALHLPSGSRGLDAGCGIGLQVLLLAEAVGAAGHVTGMDIVPEFLAFGADLAKKAGLERRVAFREGDISRLPFPEGSFDWAWSSDCIGYPAGELTPLLKELLRVVRPGGSIFLLAWTSQQVLPGHPFLEARLNASCSSYFPFLNGQSPELHFPWALRWMREAGMKDVCAQTFTGEVQDPVGRGERAALASLFEMLWGAQTSQVSPEDWREFQRLCQPGSAGFIVDQPGYYAFFNYTLFRGKAP